MDFILWLDSLIYPHDTFTAEGDKGSFSHAIKNTIHSGAIYGVITSLAYVFFPSLRGDFIVETFKHISSEYFLFLNIFLSPIIFLLILMFLSLLIYISARIFKGYGDFTTQTYLLSLSMSFLIIFSVVKIIPFIGGIMLVALLLYSIRPLLVLLKITHKYEARNALLTFLFSLLLFVALSFIVLIFLWQTSIFVFFNFETTSVGFKNVVIRNLDIFYRDSTFEFSIENKLDKSIIITELITKGDCSQGIVDVDKNTEKIETFVTIDPGKSTDVKILNCSKKYLPRGKFYIPLKFIYQEKTIGESVTHMENGIIEGLTV